MLTFKLGISVTPLKRIWTLAVVEPWVTLAITCPPFSTSAEMIDGIVISVLPGDTVCTLLIYEPGSP